MQLIIKIVLIFLLTLIGLPVIGGIPFFITLQMNANGTWPFPPLERIENRIVLENGGMIEIEAGKRGLLIWIAHSTNAMVLYYGGFPVDYVRLLIMPEPKAPEVRSGKAYGYGGAFGQRLEHGPRNGPLGLSWLAQREGSRPCMKRATIRRRD